LVVWAAVERHPPRSEGANASPTAQLKRVREIKILWVAAQAFHHTLLNDVGM
jgi:hypothetical protein